MALRAVPEHPKFAAFKTILALPKGAALGWLESVWHFAGRFTPHGDIGKYTDAQIEAWVEWDGDPGALVRALTDTGWIDANEKYRLVVHDWHVHADNATKLSVKRSKKPFCGDSVDTDSQDARHGVHTVEEIPTSLGLPGAGPVPVPEPVPGAGPVPQTFDHDMVSRAVMLDLSMSGQDLARNLSEVAKAEIAKGRDGAKLRQEMVAAHEKYRSVGKQGKLETRFMVKPANFYGDGHWSDETRWPWREGQAPPAKRKYLEVA